MIVFPGGALNVGMSMKQRRSHDPRKSHPEARQLQAEQLAIAALGFIAGEPERLGRFLALTGIGPESIRAAAGESNFLLGVLDYVAADESLLLGFAEHGGIEPDQVARAREVLAGGGAQEP
jgi:hypothetical protein